MSIDEIKMLDITERIALVEEIWDSIAQEQNSLKLSDYEKKILDERLASLYQEPDSLVSWEVLKKRVKG